METLGITVAIIVAVVMGVILFLLASNNEMYSEGQHMFIAMCYGGGGSLSKIERNGHAEYMFCSFIHTERKYLWHEGDFTQHD